MKGVKIFHTACFRKTVYYSISPSPPKKDSWAGVYRNQTVTLSVSLYTLEVYILLPRFDEIYDI